jgi:hypothetical protein
VHGLESHRCSLTHRASGRPFSPGRASELENDAG